MYILGHVAPTILIAHAADSEIDLRWPALFAIAPDLIDKPIGLLLPAVVNDNSRGFGHSLLGAFVVLAALLALRRRLGPPLILWASYVGHLVLDRLWLDANPAVLFWPLLGPFPRPMHGWENLPNLRWNVAGELIGLLIVFVLARRHRLFERARFEAFLRTGRLA